MEVLIIEMNVVLLEMVGLAVVEKVEEEVILKVLLELRELQILVVEVVVKEEPLLDLMVVQVVQE